MVTGILVKAFLNEARKMRAEHARLMRRVARTIVTDCWIFAKRNAYGYYLCV